MLLKKIKHYNIIIVFKYISCQKLESDYIKLDYSLSYSACFKLSRKYDIASFSKSDFYKINKERARLEVEKKSLEIIKKNIIRKYEIILQKRCRIRKIKRYFVFRKTKLIRRGLKNINKLEKLEV